MRAIATITTNTDQYEYSPILIPMAGASASNELTISSLRKIWGSNKDLLLLQKFLCFLDILTGIKF
jgi:hypothetical protein